MNKSIVFIDPQVGNFEVLARGLPAATEVVVLDAHVDGIEQIHAHIAGRAGVPSIHVLSHGSAGALRFGAGAADEESLLRHRSALADIGQALAPQGDILLYGCNVASGSAGASFLDRFAALTGANVTASASPTGASSLGGDAQLEVSTGGSRARPLFSQAAFDTAGIVLGVLPFSITPGSEGVFLWADTLGQVRQNGNVGVNEILIAAFTADASGTGSVNLSCFGTFDGMFKVYDQNGLPVSTVIDNGGSGGSESTIVTFTAGQIYYVAITGFQSSTGSMTLTAGVPLLASSTITTPGPTFTGSFTGSVGYGGDVDFITITAPAGATTLNLSVVPDSNLDAVMTLFNSSGTALQSFDAHGTGGTEGASNISIIGGQTYTVRIHGFTRSQTGNYTVNADFNPDQSQGSTALPSSVTPGTGSWFWAHPSGTASTSGTISTAGGSSLFAFMPDQTGSYSFAVSGNGSLDPMLRVYDNAGNALTSTIDTSSGGTEGVSLSLTAGQWVYLDVGAFGTTSGSFGLSAVGPSINNGSIATPAPTFVGSTSGTVNYGGDLDYFSITAPAGASSLNLTVTPAAGLDTFVELYNSAGVLVQTITNGGVGTADSASNIAIVGGTNYFVGVSGTSRTESGNFTINADFNPDPSQGNQTIVGTSSSETLTGGPGNDTLSGLGGDDFIDGGAGLDTAVYAGPRSSYSISASGNSFIVHAFSGTDGNDTVTNVERLHFSTSSVALDLDGNAGLTAKILGAVFGPASVSNKVFVGIGLNLLDSGMSYGDLMQLALDAAGVTSHTQEVRLLWTNLFGSAPSAADAAPFVTWLDTGFVSTSQLAVMAGELSNNASNINLVGLHLTGIEFV
jgi:hypothetical protein